MTTSPAAPPRPGPQPPTQPIADAASRRGAARRAALAAESAKSARPRRTTWLLVLGVPALAVGLAAAVLTFAPREAAAPRADPATGVATALATSPPVPANVKGRADAPVEIEEWSDFQ